MANGEQLVAELDFENKIQKMPDRELLEFTARQVYDIKETQSELSETCKCIPDLTERLAKLEAGNKKSSAVVGGIAGTVLSIIIGVAEYLSHRFGS